MHDGQVEAARRLLEAGADPSSATRDQFLRISPLGSAIAATPGVPQPSDDEGVVLALVRLLLEHGAAVDHRRADGMTPLHAAAWRDLGRVVQELLDAGADPATHAMSGPHAGETPADTALPRATSSWPASSTPASPRSPAPTADRPTGRPAAARRRACARRVVTSTARSVHALGQAT